MSILFPRPRVLRAVPLDRHTVIEASAGTGKTFTLEHLVVELLLTADVPLEQILVVTFTEKATNEIRTRVRAKLEELDAAAATLRAATPETRLATSEDHWVIDEEARSKIARAVRSFDGATITTIHAFCERVLRENAFASGRLFDERPADGREAFGRAVRDTLRREGAARSELAPWLEAALRSGRSVDDVEELLWKCTESHGSLRPTFDTRALASAVSAVPVDDVRAVDWTAWLKARRVHHSTAKSIGDRMRKLAPIVERAQRAGDFAAYVLEAEGAKLADLADSLAGLAARPDTASRTLDAVATLARATPTFDAVIAHSLLPLVARAWVHGKRQSGSYDFDDMLTLVDDALRGGRGEALAESLGRRWRYVLIDEFQDTDATQWSIFRRAFAERTSRVPRGCVYLVGDAKQSIYRFRGADVPTYEQARDAVVASGGERVPLSECYRATPALVDATNLLFDPNAPEPLLSPAMGYAPVACGRPDRALVDGDGRPLAPIHVMRFRNEVTMEAIGAAIADETKRATDPMRPWKLDGQPLRHHDVYVLTRSAREGRAIGDALRAAGVPYAFFKEDGLFQTDQAKDLRALLAAIADPDDRGCRLAAWLTPFFALPLDALERTRDLPAGHPLVARLYEWKSIADERAFDRLFERILQDSGVLRREIFFGEGERALTNTLHVIDVLLERAREGHTTLRDLAAELGGLVEQTRLPKKLEGNVQRLDGERHAVQIMTIHKAKGLEAPLVFVAGGLAHNRGRGDPAKIYHEGGQRLAWVGGNMPNAVESIVKREDHEEDERLMYVALTRAKGRLVLPLGVNDDGAPAKISGPYGRVNRRIAALLDANGDGLVVTDVAQSEEARLRAPATVGSWQPSPSLLRDDDASGHHERLRARCAGVSLTSYTRMKSGRGEPVERAGDALDVAADPATDMATLRPARVSGVFLHELLERVALASFSTAPDFEAWRARPDVRELFDETVNVHRIAPEQRVHAERLVWSAYSMPVNLPNGSSLGALSWARRAAREMKFMFAAGGPAAGDRVYVRGALDLVFEHDALAYIVDWKSDRLLSYGPDVLDRRVREHYFDQVKIYALATSKLLGIRDRRDHDARFGGVLYCFLRGFDGSGRGTWSLRPSFDDVLEWNAEIGEAASA